MDKVLEIFNEVNALMVLIDKAVMLYRAQNHYKGLLKTTEISKKLNNLIPALLENRDFMNKDYIVVDDGFMIQMLNNIVEAHVNNDYVLMADLYEGQLNPFLSTVQGTLRNECTDIVNGYWENNIAALEDRDNELCKQILKDKNTNKPGYSVEDTNVGVRTLKIQKSKNKFYLHSNNNPFHEADIFAKEHVGKDVIEYAVYGFGFGYHIRSLLESSVNINIIVYESDLHILTLAWEYCDLKDILSSKRLRIVYDPNFDKIGRSFEEKDVSFIIHYPSMMNIENKDIRERFEEFFLFFSSSKNQEDLLYRNFQKNIEKHSPNIEELKAELTNKKLVIVAGGPSLDIDIEYLRELPEEYRILAVGRVVKRLLVAGIKPHYFIMIDGNQVLLDQIRGLDLENIPLLYLSTVYYEVLEEHKGRQYLILQEGYALAEEYAKHHNLELYKSSGSVSTTAIEVGIRLGCSTIICVGLDLAFVNKQSHASGTGGNTITEVGNLREVESVDGTIIYTSKSLDSFRHWIERRIRKETDITFVNTSKGANIQGMKNKEIKEIIHSIR